jgi:hypothetical protein
MHVIDELRECLTVLWSSNQNVTGTCDVKMSAWTAILRVMYCALCMLFIDPEMKFMDSRASVHEPERCTRDLHSNIIQELTESMESI